jgi:hypothetical protein
MLELGRFSIGIGDRFGRQGRAQLRALERAAAAGAAVTPVWNKSFREHSIIGTSPVDQRRAADAAVKAAAWTRPYFVDADHVGAGNVEGFLPWCDFFTLDVSETIGRAPEAEALDRFVAAQAPWTRRALPLGGSEARVSGDDLRRIGTTYLAAAAEAGRLYRRIEAAKGAGAFIAEVSLDECERSPSPVELFFVLAMLAAEGVPARTIAPRFSGRFNKGVDYVGDVEIFRREFEADLDALALAVNAFGLPRDLKLSVHSGSDKFSLYPVIGAALRRRGAGVHLKTAGTTWLEEIAGLAASGGAGLRLAREVYREARRRREELCGPYASVIDIRADRLPDANEAASWTAEEFAATIRHDPSSWHFNSDVRQLLHVGYRVAAEMGERFLSALEANAAVIGRGVEANLFERHIRPLFLEVA